MSELDRRLHAFRPDLADAALEGRVKAERFVEPRPARVAAPVLEVRSAPHGEAGVDTQLLSGDAVGVFEEREGWAWVQAETDGYVGYVAAAGLEQLRDREKGGNVPEAPGRAPTHVVMAPRSFVYPGPDLKLPVVAAHSMGARVRVEDEAETRGTRYALLSSGAAMIASHLRRVDRHEADYVAVAERLIHAPYLWGGTSGFGVDCSGIVQLALRMTGITVLRDTDMQEESIGSPLDPGKGLRRGDLVFWKGHVAIMTDPETVIHANGASMMVSRETLESAIARIAPFFGEPRRYRRP